MSWQKIEKNWPTDAEFSTLETVVDVLSRGVGRNLEKGGIMDEIARAKRAKNLQPETMPTIRKQQAQYSCQEALTIDIIDYVTGIGNIEHSVIQNQRTVRCAVIPHQICQNSPKMTHFSNTLECIY